MKLMLAGIIMFIVLGLVSHQLGRRQSVLAVMIATGMTALYLSSQRFM